MYCRGLEFETQSQGNNDGSFESGVPGNPERKHRNESSSSLVEPKTCYPLKTLLASPIAAPLIINSTKRRFSRLSLSFFSVLQFFCPFSFFSFFFFSPSLNLTHQIYETGVLPSVAPPGMLTPSAILGPCSRELHS